MFENTLKESIVGRAVKENKVNINIVNFRDYSKDKHKKVDDSPYGGGAGMVLKPEPLFDAVDDIKRSLKKPVKVVLLTPQGQVFNQKKAEKFSLEENLIFICGHYEGFDERVRIGLVDEEISIGDYILTGGEFPALVVVDAIVRLIPGVLGSQDSHITESFTDDLLEYPQYTRPSEYRGMKVPDVLLSGNHKEIEIWRKEQAVRRTKERRPEL